MAKRKETPNIMEELFGQDQPAPASSEEQQPEKPAAPAKVRETQKSAGPPLSLKKYMEEEKIKGSFYLSPDTLEELEEAWIRLRKMVAKLEPEQKSKVSKSLLVEAALQIVLAELDQEALESRLAKKITSFW